MIQVPVYGDERQLAFCAFCGGKTGTRDHCPSRVLLDEPYPENLPVVPACAKCNAGFSSDEQYLACLISCVLSGSTDPANVARPKISRILSENPKLRARIERSRTESSMGIVFNPEHQRVSNVITKLAQGHSLYELHEPHPEQPDSIQITPLALMSDAERESLESPCIEGLSIWPEVGSRAMHRIVLGSEESSPDAPWLVVQPGLYRFRASVDSGVSVRIVIQEYLACTVRWD
jgi:hypothetical protein